jgi:hypothetical protein
MSTLIRDSDRPFRAYRFARLLLFALWVASLSFLCWHHQLWRDEVRALSLALTGDNLIGMVSAVHGEGHPLLWYALLRLSHTLVGVQQILPLTAALIATGAATLLVFRSPFGILPVALLLFGRMMLFEYGVMARNYGITMLLLFVIASVYRRYKRDGYLIGFLLLLLTNTNVHAVLLAAAFLLFWLLDLISEDGVHWTPALTRFAINSALAAIGTVICVATVYPPFNDAAERVQTTLPIFGIFSLGGFKFDGPAWLMPALLYGTVAGFIRRPAAAIALLLALLGMSVFFIVINPGGYRHSALWLSLAVALYWIAFERGNDPQKSAPSVKYSQRLTVWIARFGQAAFLVLLAFQARAGIGNIVDTVRGKPPLSRSADFAALVRSRPDLGHAIIIADPDYLIEPLPYYLKNLTYLTREERFGNVVAFTKNARLEIGLTDMLSKARNLADTYRVPIIIILSTPLDGVTEPEKHPEGYNWIFTIDPEQVAAFRASTKALGSFRPAESDESFDAYLLTP